MRQRCDFLEILNSDMSLKIFSHLEEPTDVARLCGVSKKWYRFVIKNQVCRKFCLNRFPELSKMAAVVEVPSKPETVNISSGMRGLSRSLVREHRVFSFLACFSKLYVRMCGVRKHLKVEHKVEEEPVFWENWCRKREGDSTVLGTIFYKPVHTLCFISEIYVATFPDPEDPIYFPRAVRFSFGYPKSLAIPKISPTTHAFDDDLFVWTYRSQEFPTVAKENGFRRYCLPRPVLSIGGMVKMELLGGVQKINLGSCYYIRITDIKDTKHSLIPMLDADIVDDAGSFILKWCLDEAYGQRLKKIKTHISSPRNTPFPLVPQFLRRL